MAVYILQKSPSASYKNTLAIKHMRLWAEELAHMCNRDADMQEHTQALSCYKRGLAKTKEIAKGNRETPRF